MIEEPSIFEQPPTTVSIVLMIPREAPFESLVGTPPLLTCSAYIFQARQEGA